VKEIVFTGIANGISLLDKEMKESGALLVDIGDSLTEISAFLSGSLQDFDIIDLGGRDAGRDFRSSAALNEIATHISARLSVLSKGCRKAPSVVITGGLALADGVIEHLEERLSSAVKIGSLKNVYGDISRMDGLRLATAIGLCGYVHEKRLSEERRLDKLIWAKIAELFNDYF
jgi:cell division ATPase FtsA